MQKESPSYTSYHWVRYFIEFRAVLLIQDGLPQSACRAVDVKCRPSVSKPILPQKHTVRCADHGLQTHPHAHPSGLLACWPLVCSHMYTSRVGATESCHHPRLLALGVACCQLNSCSLVASGSLGEADLGGLGGHVVGVDRVEAA